MSFKFNVHVSLLIQSVMMPVGLLDSLILKKYLLGMYTIMYALIKHVHECIHIYMYTYMNVHIQNHMYIFIYVYT
jgi:hypothetical protein